LAQLPNIKREPTTRKLKSMCRAVNKPVFIDAYLILSLIYTRQIGEFFNQKKVGLI
jgi:hypothetical protein